MLFTRKNRQDAPATWCHRCEAIAGSGLSAAENVLQGLSGRRQVSPCLELASVLARSDALPDVVGQGKAARGEEAEKHSGFAFRPASTTSAASHLCST